MRWLVLFLIVANAALVAWFSLSAPENVRSVDEGRLPRVAEIELIGSRDEEGEMREQERTSSALGESAPGGAAPSQLASLEPKPSQKPEASTEPVQASATSCFGIGWFEDEDGAEAYRRDHIGEDSGWRFSGLTERREPLEPFHWVMIPPMDSRQVALERYRELVDQGIEAYVVPSGERENAISLGLFRSLRSAEGILQRRQEQNINAVLVKFPRNRISYALVFEGVSPTSLESFDGASGPGEDGRQLIEFSDCEGVATAEKNP